MQPLAAPPSPPPGLEQVTSAGDRTWAILWHDRGEREVVESAAAVRHRPGHRFRCGQQRRTWTLIHVVEGATEFTLPGRAGATILGPGEVALFPPRTAHDERCAQATDVVYVLFDPRPDLRALLDWPEPQPGLGLLSVRGTGAEEPVTTALREMVWFERVTVLPNHAALASNALERALLYLDGCNPRRQLRTQDERITRAVTYLTQHCCRPVTVAEVAREASLSPSHLHQRFREQTGMTPQQYHEQQRLQEARRLLRHSELTVQQIASALGYASPEHFSTRFRRCTGHAPSVYRANGDGA